MSVISVALNPETENLNAFGGSLLYPAEWTLKSITSSYENVQYWIRSPQGLSDGRIEFSAIFPGGIHRNLNDDSAQNLTLFHVEFNDEIGEEMLARLALENPEFYLNVAGPILASEAHFSTALIAVEESVEPDLTPPELLDYSFEKNPLTNREDLFLNVYDESGEPVYIEVKEGFFSSWKPLEESELTEAPFAIRLTDRAGNSGIIELRASSLEILPWVAWLTAFLILAIFTYFRPRFRH